MNGVTRLDAFVKRLVFVCWLPAFAGCLSVDDAQPAAAQRPTLSSDTATTAVGTLETEIGIEVEPRGSYLIPATLKCGAGESTEVFGTWIPRQGFTLNLGRPSISAGGGSR